MGICKSLCIKSKTNKNLKDKENLLKENKEIELNKLNQFEKNIELYSKVKDQKIFENQNQLEKKPVLKKINPSNTSIPVIKLDSEANNQTNDNFNINDISYQKKISVINQMGDLNKNIIINSSLLVGKASGKISDNYRKIKQLGKGGFGTVFLVSHLPSNQERAMKVIMKRQTQNIQVDMEIMNEIKILIKLDHPNIVKIFEFYNTHRYYYLITELCKGGDLFDKIIAEGPFNEKVTSHIIFQILNAVNYCHKMNIIHRDLKPENILIEKYEYIDKLDLSYKIYRIKIIDFGTAKIFEKNKIETQVIGSSYYMAPEVLLKNYNEKCDLWSCGVILYILLSGRPPFTGINNKSIMESIQKGNYDLESEIWKNISLEGKDLIRHLLDKNVSSRLSAEDALGHQWFKINKTKELFNYIEPQKVKKILSNLQKNNYESVLKKIAMAYLIHNNPQNAEVEDAFKLFNLIDKLKMEK